MSTTCRRGSTATIRIQSKSRTDNGHSLIPLPLWLARHNIILPTDDAFRLATLCLQLRPVGGARVDADLVRYG